MNLRLRRESEFAQAELSGLNAQLRQLHRLGLTGDTMMLGPIVLKRPWSLDQPMESMLVIQAGLALPNGFGAVYWDSEELRELEREPERLLSKAFESIKPFEDCPPAVQALISPYALRLLHQTMRRIEFIREEEEDDELRA